MPADPLREMIRALVEEWRRWSTSEVGVLHFRSLWGVFPGSRCRPVDDVAEALRECAAQLDALLAESEPEPDRSERLGCGRDHGGGSWNANCPDCEAKAKLPLGHEFVPHKRQA